MKVVFVLLLVLVLTACTEVEPEEIVMKDNYKTATFAGGCFWCIETPFDAEPGVVTAESGYIGGDASDANYEAVSSGKTKHREAVRVTYDPSKVNYSRLVELFFWQIDPTDPEGQFADKGYHYTTAVYYENDDEKRVIEKEMQKIRDSGRFEKPLVTEVLPVSEFYLAEDYHQDYASKAELRYNTYKKLSGRSGFIKRVWGK